jgi:hypothetical protein
MVNGKDVFNGDYKRYCIYLFVPIPIFCCCNLAELKLFKLSNVIYYVFSKICNFQFY